MVVSGQMSHEPVEVVKRKRNLVLAQVSLGIAFVFIMCHSIKWIPNIYELLQVCNKHKATSKSTVESRAESTYLKKPPKHTYEHQN